MNHVNNKTVIGLAVAAGIAVIAAIALGTARQPEAPEAKLATATLPELDNHLNDIQSLTITGPGQKVIATIERGAGGWSVKEKGGYRADAGKVREYLLKLAQSRLLEGKTANEQRYAELGVGDISAADAKGLLLAVGGLGKPVQLILGNVNVRGDSTFVRRAGDKQSWLAKGNLLPDKSVANWLDKSIVDIPSTRLREVVIERPKLDQSKLDQTQGKPLRVSRQQPADTNFVIADLPKGREASSEFAANSLGTTLAGLTLEDVLPAAQMAAPAQTYRSRFVAFDGLVVDVAGWKLDDKFYAQFKADKDAALAESAAVAAQVKAKADWEAEQKANSEANANVRLAAPLFVRDPAADKAERLAALDAEIAAINQRLAGWTYQLSQYKFANLEKGVDEFLKPLDEKKAAAKK